VGRPSLVTMVTTVCNVRVNKRREEKRGGNGGPVSLHYVSRVMYDRDFILDFHTTSDGNESLC
jgi:hypothetical protein